MTITRNADTLDYIIAYANDDIDDKVAEKIIKHDLNVFRIVLNDMIENGIAKNDWGGDDQYFDYSPAIIDSFHAIISAIHNEEIGFSLKSESGIDYKAIMDSLYKQSEFVEFLSVTDIYSWGQFRYNPKWYAQSHDGLMMRHFFFSDDKENDLWGQINDNVYARNEIIGAIRNGDI